MSMSLIDLKALIFAQICIDIVVIVLFVLFFKRFRGVDDKGSLGKGVETVSSLLSDADRLAVELKKQLHEKKLLINQLNEQLDQSVMSLRAAHRRSEYLLAEHRRVSSPPGVSPDSDDSGKRVVKMAQKGCDVESIADSLSIPREKVKLLLDMRKSEITSRRKAGAA